MDALEQAEQIRTCAVAAMDLLEDWIEANADQRTRPDARTAEALVHDFVCFAITKGARSLDSAFGLLGHARAEDALTLSRSAYECYLHASFVETNPARVDDFVQSKLAAYSGDWPHPETKRGRKIWQQVVNPYTGEVFPHGCSIRELVDGGGAVEDRAVHDDLYGFLSQNDHLHVASLGAYCSDGYDHFLLNKPGSMLFQGLLYTGYITWLLCSMAATSRECGGISRGDADVLFGLRDVLVDALRSIEEGGHLGNLTDTMESRLMAQRYEIALPAEAVEALLGQKQRFRDQFGRDPGEGDPLFWDPDSDVPKRIDPAAYEEMVRSAIADSNFSVRQKRTFRRMLLDDDLSGA